MATPPTIEDFQLIREEQHFDFLPNSYLGFLSDFLGPVNPLDASWQYFNVYKTVENAVDESPRLGTPGSNDSDGPALLFLHSYAVSVQRQTYVILNARLSDEDDRSVRHTDMRLSQMIVANWVAAAGDLRLENLGVKLIINDDSRAAIVDEFAHAAARGAAGEDDLALGVTRARALAWAANPFLKCADHVANVMAGSTDKVRAWLIRDDTKNIACMIMDMYVELDYVDEQDQDADDGEVTDDTRISMQFNLEMATSGSTNLQINFVSL